MKKRLPIGIQSFSRLRSEVENSKFANYWFNTATPTFLMKMLRNSNRIDPILKPIETDTSVFSSYDPVDIGEIPLLFQTGYLTIKSVATMEAHTELYTLDIPNSEVRDSFTKYLLHAYSDYPLEKMLKCEMKELCEL